MTKFNDINMDNWKETDVWTDSLWIIDNRDNSGKHDGFYHGNFVPQIPRQLIKRYTKKNDTVFDPFIGSGTTAYECEALERNIIGIDIQKKLVKHINEKLGEETGILKEISCADSSDGNTYEYVAKTLKKWGKPNVQLVLLHPPYADIIKFSESEHDLSNNKTIDDFISQFSKVLEFSVSVLEVNRYLAIVIGDKYTNGEWIPLSFYCMQAAQRQGLLLKSVIVKNMSNSRGKQNKEGIWRYRALSSDYYIFKHEYLFIFKKVVK